MSEKKSYLYQHDTWPELKERVNDQPVVVLPIGSVEDHGYHLPLDVDNLCIWSISEEAAKRAGGDILLMPLIPYGFETHHMDFPGTINTHYETFIKQVLDVTQSLAYHGFKKIILLNGHGSNMPNLDLVARRTNLETDAECVLIAWWSLLTIDKEFLPSWRESKFPGGCSHAGELETSLDLYLDEEGVRKDKIKSGVIKINEDNSPFCYVDLFGHGPAALTSWTSSYSETGVLGEAETATKEKDERAYNEAVKQLSTFIEWFQKQPIDVRHAEQVKHTIPMPWGQRDKM